MKRAHHRSKRKHINTATTPVISQIPFLSKRFTTRTAWPKPPDNIPKSVSKLKGRKKRSYREPKFTNTHPRPDYKK